MECWYHQTQCLESVPEGYCGYIYKITNLLTGKIYVGKKAFTHSTKKRVSKRVIKATKTRQRIVRGTKDSGWMNYYGSSKELLADIKLLGKENFLREILCFCSSKAELTYMEGWYQMKYDVLKVDSYNGWIKMTVYKTTLNK